MFKNLFFLLIAIVLYASCVSKPVTPEIKLGIDVLMEHKLELLKGKRVGVITNQTGINPNGDHIIDLLHKAPDVELVALFGPEHGLRGNVEGGFKINNQVDEKTGVPILSIYGKNKKPTQEMLKNIDVLIFDIQDVGTRFYTYISTMSLCMEAAAENNIEFIVLDRPNPITGTIVEGPMLESEYKSFIGIQPIPLRHGMTVGELAKLFNGEGWLSDGVIVDLKIIKLENWKRDSWFNEYDLKWVKPSPNMPSPTTALLYAGMGLLETCNINEGRGTKNPFEQVGTPWMDNVKVLEMLEAAIIPGIQIDTISYIPIEMPGASVNPDYKNELCKGLIFKITDPHKFLSVKLGIHFISAVYKNHPDKFKWNSERRARIMFGNASTPEAISNSVSPEEIIKSLEAEITEFKKIRKKYLLYE